MMDCRDNTAEEDPLICIDTGGSGGGSLTSSASTSSMTELSDPGRSSSSVNSKRRSSKSLSLEIDRETEVRKHMNTTRFRCFWSRTGIWISHSRLLCLMMTLDLMTLSVQIPSMPAAFESHGMDLRWQGWVASVYGIISFFVGPMLGRVSDSVGRVAMLRMSCVGSLIAALGSLYATGKWTFIAARTLPALLKCSIPISQAYIVDVSQGNAERSKNLGMLGASLGVAFIIGPPLGGTAADYDIRLPFVISSLECILLYIALQFLPEPVKPSVLSKKADSGEVEGGGSAERVGVVIDQAEVVTASTISTGPPSSRPRSSRLGTPTPPPSSSSRTGASPLPTGGGGEASFFSATPARGVAGGSAESSSSSSSSVTPSSSQGLKRTRSSLLVAAESGRQAFAEAARGGGIGVGGGGGGNTSPRHRVSPTRPRGKTLGGATVSSATGGGGPPASAAGAVKATPGAVKQTAVTGGGGGGRLSIFRGAGGLQLAWGFHDRFFLVLAESMYHTSFAPFLTSVLAFPTGRVGFLLSFLGLVSAVTNGFLVGVLTRRFGEGLILATSLTVVAVGWVMWSTVSGSLPSILAALTLAGVGSNVFQTVNKASVAQNSPPELVGTVMGMSAALETFGRSIAGPMSGYLFDAVGPRGIPLTCSCAAAYVAIALSFRALTDAVRKDDDTGSEAGGGGGGGGVDGPHKRGGKIDIKRK